MPWSGRVRSSTLVAADNAKPQIRPRRTMSVSSKYSQPRVKQPASRPRVPSPVPDDQPLPQATARLQPNRLEACVEVESTYSTPWPDHAPPARRRISSVSSTSSSLSSASSSSPSSPTSSPEEFWSKYRRSPDRVKKLRCLLSSLSVVEAAVPVDEVEPLYTEIYGARPGQVREQPPLPRRNSVSKPPARPPYPASSIRKSTG